MLVSNWYRFVRLNVFDNIHEHVLEEFQEKSFIKESIFSTFMKIFLSTIVSISQPGIETNSLQMNSVVIIRS